MSPAKIIWGFFSSLGGSISKNSDSAKRERNPYCYPNTLSGDMDASPRFVEFGISELLLVPPMSPARIIPEFFSNDDRRA
jgi:hypothetical protein